MKSALTAGLLASLLLMQQAAATSWGESPSFSCPSNTDNDCTTDQKSGFDWSTLPAGGFSSYGGFGFSGFTCQDSFKSKRSLEARTGFSGKCIQGTLTPSANGGPSFSCSQGDKFSISQMDVSVSHDTDVDFVFTMPDGSCCKHTASCQASGTTVKNSQCGGAKSVTLQLPPSSGKGSCDIGIHNIGFDCDTTPPPGPPAGTTTTTTTTTPHVRAWTTTTTTTPAGQHTTTTTTTPAGQHTTTTTTTPVVHTTTTTTTPAGHGSTTTTTTPAGQHTTTTTTPAGHEYTTTTTTTPAGHEHTTTTTTPVELGSTTTTPAGHEHTTTTTTTPAGTTTTPAESTTTPVVWGVSSSTTTPVTGPSTTPGGLPPIGPSPPCPPVLPRCLNTWLTIAPSCSSNSDANCFCPSVEFIVNVQACVSAWGTTDVEITAALSYLAGICADFVPQNPGICTGVPSTITLVATPPPVTETATVTVTNGNGRGSRPPVSGWSTPAPVPVTTVTFTYTAQGSVVTSTIIVPQVTFVTGAATGTATAAGVGLVAWPTPTPAPAGAAPYATGAWSPSSTSDVSPARFTGAASKHGAGFGMLAGALAVAAYVL